MHSHLFKARQADISLYIEDNESVQRLFRHVHLIADKHKLGQVMRNLVSNGIKFTGAGGTIAVKLSMVSGKSNANAPPTESNSRWWCLSTLYGTKAAKHPSGLAKRDIYVAGHGQRLAVGEDGMEQFLRIEVIDSGAGISKVCECVCRHIGAS